jgi:hypothetical protein
MSDEDNTTSPVRQARNDALAAKLRFDQGRHGLAQQELEVLRRQWQTYLWHYYSQIAGYKQTRNIEDEWHEPIAEGTHPDSLADLEEYQFAVEKVEERADALRAISAKLDECYHALGFDEPPRKVVKHSGYLESEHPEWFSEEFTLDVWQRFIEEVDPEGGQAGSLDEAVEHAVEHLPEEESPKP